MVMDMGRRQRDFPNIDDLIHQYNSGHSIAQIAMREHACSTTIKRAFVSRGATFRNQSDCMRKRHAESNMDILADVATAYRGGMSENAVAKKFRVSRSAIRRLLLISGCHIRTQSEAEFLKWSQMTEDQRIVQVASAHDKVRGMKRSYSDLSTRAKGKEKTLGIAIGDGEITMIEWLSKRGITASHQVAAGKYNLDVSAYPFAIEIHKNCWRPHGIPRIRERIEFLRNAGWHVIYVWLTKSAPLDEKAADIIAGLIGQIGSDAPDRGQYLIIRGSGEPVNNGEGHCGGAMS